MEKRKVNQRKDGKETAEQAKKRPKFEKTYTNAEHDPPATLIGDIKLTTSSHKLLVQALVTNKSDVRTFQNGQGKFFNFIVNDKSGAIKITAFNKEVDTFFSLVEEGKVYRISNANTRVANTNYPRVNTYELLLKNDSTIKLCDDTGDIPMQQYKFVSISKLDEMDPTLKPTVDVIGVCRSVRVTNMSI